MTDHQKILDWLSDKNWHCSIELDFMRDARKRISELLKRGYPIEGMPCNGRCSVVHKSKTLKMRRLAPQKLQNAPNAEFLWEKVEYSTPMPQNPNFKGENAKNGGSGLHPTFQKVLYQI